MQQNVINKNNIFNSIATLGNFLFPLITFPYVTRVLGIDNIGIYNFSSSVVSYFSLIATLGISTYAIRECAKVRENRNEFDSLASEIYSINVYSTLIAYVFLFIALYFSYKLKNYTTAILLLSTSFAANTIGTTWVCNAVDDFKYLSVRTIILHIVALVGLFLFVKSENDLYIYIGLSVLSNVGANLFNIFYRRRYVDIKFICRPNVKRHFKKIILLFSQTVSMLLYTNADMIMIGYYYNDEMVGLYAITVRIYNIVNSVISSVITVATPGLSYDYNVRDYDAFNDKITYVANYILLLFLPAFVGLNMMAPEIISIVAGSSYIISVTALRILSISLMFSLISAVLGFAILFPMGYDKVNFYSCIISASSNIILNLYFIPKYGVVGAAFTTAIAELLGFINKIKYIDKKIKINNFWRTFAKYFVGSILVLVICVIFKKIIDKETMRGIITILSSGLVYFTYLLIIRDQFFINLIKPVLNKLTSYIKK